MEYTVVIYEAEEGGYWAKVPALPGCYSQGETLEETLENVTEAIENYSLALRSDGQEISVEKAPQFRKINVAV
jgi:predicted RNase H-like HicB family nuclease